MKKRLIVLAVVLLLVAFMASVSTAQTYWRYYQPYKSYIALVTQSSTNAPVAVVLYNTLGFTPVWTYTSAGLYKATLPKAGAAAGAGPLDDSTTVVFTTLNLASPTKMAFSGAFATDTTLVFTTVDTLGVVANGVLTGAAVQILLFKTKGS